MKSTLTKARSAMLLTLSSNMGVSFNDYQMLHQALTHTSYANECKTTAIDHNERLEFLGDAVLELIISDHLFRRFPNLPEGELTKARAAIVCEPTLARRARMLKLGDYLLLGKGEAATGGRDRVSILADAFEAVIGALYLDGGYNAAAAFVLNQLQQDIEMVEQGNHVNDFKTLLQEVVQRNGECKINYEVLNERGPDHDKVFHTAVVINGKRMGAGVGKSKKEAEQQAAREALLELKIL